MARRQRYSNSNGDTIEYQPNSNKPVDNTDYSLVPKNWTSSEIVNLAQFINQEFQYQYNTGLSCFVLNSSSEEFVINFLNAYEGSILNQYSNAGNSLSPFTFTNAQGYNPTHPLLMEDVYFILKSYCYESSRPQYDNPMCMLCPEENQMGQPNPTKPPIQTAGCTFNDDGSVSTVKVPSGFRGINSWLQTNDCPTTGWNSDGIYVTTNPPSSSGGVSSGGVSSGGVSSGTTRPTKPTKPKKKKRKLGKRVQKRVQGFSGDWYNRY